MSWLLLWDFHFMCIYVHSLLLPINSLLLFLKGAKYRTVRALLNRLADVCEAFTPYSVTTWCYQTHTSFHTFMSVNFVCRTIRNLGMMNGALLLAMKRDDIRAICPEEGGRVFFQLQAVKSSVAVCINVHAYKHTSFKQNQCLLEQILISICLYIYNKHIVYKNIFSPYLCT